MPALNKETLGYLEKAYKGNDLAGFLHDSLQAAEAIRAAVSQNQEDEEAEIERHKLAKGEINRATAAIRKDCLHWQTTYYPDPSGNNDSSTCCDICGKELNREERKKWIPK
jgi:DNA repair exonuclease SbcCD ATPase subunit